MKKIRFILTLAVMVSLIAGCQSSGNKKSAGPAVSAVRGETHMALPSEKAPASAEDIDTEVPTIRFISKGSILPSSGSLDLLFGSVSYAKAQVRVKKVFSNNILQFLQLDSYETRYELYKVADVVAATTLVLGDNPSSRRTSGTATARSATTRPTPSAAWTCWPATWP